MGLIKPLPHTPPHTQGDFAGSVFHETNVLHLKKRYPLTSVILYCNMLLRMYLCYILHYYHISGKYFIPIESSEVFITVYWV